jgi:EAL domain-containing protein (putative c-di-GMP-specific phosphodiesterase class I)
MRASMAAAPMPMLGEGVRVTCSIGVAPVEKGEITIETALQAARGQLSRSKSAGKDRVCRPEPRQEGDHAAREVVAGRGLRAFHQPVYDLLENRIAGYELLTRGPEGAYERPAEFLPLLGSGSDLTRFDLECLRVCAEAARRMPPTACLHFNLFPSTLLEVGAETVLRVLERAGGDRVTCIELNERGIPGDSPQLLEHVAALKRAGVQLAIDDVGFGSSSLEALLYLDPEVIKVDHACVEAPDCARILERLLGVAGVLRARVIAEGVSDEEILARLLEKHVRFGQGFLWGHPEAVLRGEKPWPLPRRRVAAAQRAAATDESQSVPLSKET